MGQRGAEEVTASMNDQVSVGLAILSSARKRPAVRVLAAGITALTVLAAVVAPAAAAGPVRSTGSGFDFTIPAGDVCPFAVQWVANDSNMNVATYPVQPNGDQLTRKTGTATDTLTNVDTGKTLVLSESPEQEWISHADGSVDLWVDGTIIGAAFPTDFGGPYLRLFTGHLHWQLDAEGDLLASSFDGTYTDLCAALAS